MTQQMTPQLAQILSGAGMAQVRVPSQAEMDEVRRVQGMQVRTHAAEMATKLLAGKAPRMTEWWSVARAVELYIQDGSGTDDPPAPVRTGA